MHYFEQWPNQFWGKVDIYQFWGEVLRHPPYSPSLRQSISISSDPNDFEVRTWMDESFESKLGSFYRRDIEVRFLKNRKKNGLDFWTTQYFRKEKNVMYPNYRWKIESTWYVPWCLDVFGRCWLKLVVNSILSNLTKLRISIGERHR